MADLGRAPVILKAGELLMWRVCASSADLAEARANEMGHWADLHKLGSWGVAAIGLGDSCWFDLILAKDIDDVFAALLFGRLPDERY
jgi:hypothetical protein